MADTVTLRLTRDEAAGLKGCVIEDGLSVRIGQLQVALTGVYEAS